MPKTFGLLCRVAFVVLAMTSAATANPLTAARQEFETLCATCHGVSGRGDGPTAASLKFPPADLTHISKRNGGTFPRQKVFDTIVGFDRPVAHGSQDMPVWGDIFIAEEVGGSLDIEDAQRSITAVTKRLEGLVDYIESLQVSE